MGRSTTIDHLTAEQLRRHRFPFPPVSEQREIASTLDTQLEHHQMLDQKVRRAIATLREYRSALITNAVTGQLDLSDWTPDDGDEILDESELTLEQS